MEKYRVEPMDTLDLVCPDPSSNITTPQPCKAYLELDTQDGKVRLDARMQVETAVPFDVWHGLVRRYPLPYPVDAKSLSEDINAGEFNELFDEIRGLIEADWDGSNWVARAKDEHALWHAEEELCKKLENYVIHEDGAGVWDASDWIGQGIDEIIAEYGIAADTTDERLQEIADDLETDARKDFIVLYRTVEYLTEVRDSLQEQAEER